MADLSKFIQTSEAPSLRHWRTVTGSLTLPAGQNSASVDIPIEHRQFVVNSLIKLRGAEWWSVGQMWARNKADTVTQDDRGWPVHSDWREIIVRHFQVNNSTYRVVMENMPFIGYHTPNSPITCDYRLDFFLSPFDTET